MNVAEKIQLSLDKFALNLHGKNVLTEAATGNYVVTPIIAAAAGANVFAITQNSKFGTISEVEKQTNELAELLGVSNNIQIISSIDEIDLSLVDVVTNTGFVRPINERFIKGLSNRCVIPLMWEPWEFRGKDIDLSACQKKGIKVYGTNESDPRLETFSYIGLTTLYFLLKHKMTPKNVKVLLLADSVFGKAINTRLTLNGYDVLWLENYEEKLHKNDFDVIIFAEHKNPSLLIGNEGFIDRDTLKTDTLLVHISGNVDFTGVECKKTSPNPAPFGYMSYTADFIDNMAVVDLHTAGLKVAEGMLKANDLGLDKKEYKIFMEENYPALAFSKPEYW